MHLLLGEPETGVPRQCSLVVHIDPNSAGRPEFDGPPGRDRVDRVLQQFPEPAPHCRGDRK